MVSFCGTKLFEGLSDPCAGQPTRRFDCFDLTLNINALFMPRPCPALRTLSLEFFAQQKETIPERPHEIARNPKTRRHDIIRNFRNLKKGTFILNIKSKALEANIADYHVEVSIDRKYLPLQQVMSQYYGIMEGVNTFLEELAHPL